jgi:RNA polymerase sigma-B factor
MRTFEHQQAVTADPPDDDLIATVQAAPRGSYERELACTELVRRYDHLVRGTAQRYRNSPESIEELMQSGYVGLLKAINNYDAELGFDLATYARPCIAGEIKRHFRDKRWALHVRRAAQELRADVIAGTSALAQRLAREPTDVEVADHLGITVADLADARRADLAFSALSLDAQLSDESRAGQLGDFLGEEDGDLDTALSMDAVWTHIGELPKREQDMLAMRFYGHMTQAEIGSKIGVSQMHVSRLLQHALAYLRDRLTAE